MPSERSVVVDIGDMPVRLSTQDAPLIDLLRERYGPFLNAAARPRFDFAISVVEPGELDGDPDLQVRASDGCWRLARADFRAEWSTHTGRGAIFQTRNPYTVDSVLRILHSVILSTEGGFLLHAASVVRAGHAAVFTGPSGAGKTTLAGLAPRSATLLSDEISYVRGTPAGYVAYGTPFAGELGQAGEPVSAPLAAIYALEHGTNTVDRLGTAEALRTLLRNVLFFSDDAALTERLFRFCCECAQEIPMYRLAFRPDERAWDLVA
ncbi:MAG TPA: hypothetical protein VK886_07990 [Vicinamibacterales bacterium]|nr:hypothetical protein [Vicinamibacterales bacterium]